MTGSASHPDPGRPLGRTGLTVSPLAYGAFKIGRNQGIKYPRAYDLPDEQAVDALLNGILDLGVSYVDTAPAYGLSEERIGRAIAHRRDEFILSTKVGETFEDGRSSFDFSGPAITASLHRSLDRLRCEQVDIVFVHSDGRDLEILRRDDTIAAMQAIKQRGLARSIGFSGKTPAGAEAAMDWADVLMVEYSPEHREHEAIIATARARGIGIVVKKGLASGHLDAAQSIRFVLANAGVSSLVVGSLSLEHMARNVEIAAGAVAED
jgi:aryl-alcohol dehydrogenase-like predicted oxidoreductase